VKAFPGSYKLWFGYLNLRAKQVNRAVPTLTLPECQKEWQTCNDLFERALSLLHKVNRFFKIF